MGLCFQCGRVGHEATRCIHPYDGATANRPYGDWLRAGTKPRTDGSRGNTDSSPHRSAAQPSLARVTENPPMTSEDVDPITGIFGADKTGPTTDISTPQITEITSTRPNTSKPDLLRWTIHQHTSANHRTTCNIMKRCLNFRRGTSLACLFCMGWTKMK